MKTERELFEVEMEKLIGKVLSIKYSEEDGGYVAHKLMMSDESTKMLVNIFNFSFAMWQASANREGFKLVPNSFIADIHDMALDGKYLRETDQTQDKFEEIQEYCKELMINAV